MLWRGEAALWLAGAGSETAAPLTDRIIRPRQRPANRVDQYHRWPQNGRRRLRDPFALPLENREARMPTFDIYAVDGTTRLNRFMAGDLTEAIGLVHIRFERQDVELWQDGDPVAVVTKDGVTIKTRQSRPRGRFASRAE